MVLDFPVLGPHLLLHEAQPIAIVIRRLMRVSALCWTGGSGLHAKRPYELTSSEAAYVRRKKVSNCQTVLPLTFPSRTSRGPLLLEVMRGNLTRQQAVIKWNAEEKHIEKQKRKRAKGGMALIDAVAAPTLQRGTSYESIHDRGEVRRCMGKLFSAWSGHGVLPLHPQIRSESSDVEKTTYFLRRLREVESNDRFLYEMQQAWRNKDASVTISCTVCTGERASKGRFSLSKDVKYICSGPGCSSDDGQLEWPENHLVPEDLRHAVTYVVHAKCAHCQVRATADAKDVFECNSCDVKKHLLDYSASCCRQLLQRERRTHAWRCVDCQYPECKLCDARPEMPVSHNHVEADGSWY